MVLNTSLIQSNSFQSLLIRKHLKAVHLKKHSITHWVNLVSTGNIKDF